MPAAGTSSRPSAVAVGDPKAQPARSLYNGVRLALTQSPDGTLLFSAQAKRTADHWSEWNALIPCMVEKRDRPLHNVREALDLLTEWAEEVWERHANG